jgi:hypothetical protein
VDEKVLLKKWGGLIIGSIGTRGNLNQEDLL